jgi:Asp-tRNA(Asn)/Glu-tRNA(Gln) amidotransferase A subunit family amidase
MALLSDARQSCGDPSEINFWATQTLSVYHSPFSLYMQSSMLWLSANCSTFVPFSSCLITLFGQFFFSSFYFLLITLPSSSKQAERARQFSALKHSHSAPLTEQEEHVLTLSLADIVTSCSTGLVKPSVVRDAFLKRTVIAHETTNCITEFLPDNHSNPYESDSRPFLGVPISIKDSFDIQGHDTTVGYARHAGCPAKSSSVIVDMLLSAGATLHVKTTVPTGLLGLETSSDLFGYTTNPYSSDHSAGASTGGGAALLAYKGSIIEVGSDIGGSVRIPAHFCGIYSLKASLGRFPQTGSATCTPGLQSIHAVTSPMAENLDDLEEFCHRFVDLSPWRYDHTCVPVPWRHFPTENKKFKFGVIWDDGIVPPSPACLRALNMVVDALKQQGHEVVDLLVSSYSLCTLWNFKFY